MKWSRYYPPSDRSSKEWGYHAVPFNGSSKRYRVTVESDCVRVYEYSGIGIETRFKLLREYSGQQQNVIDDALEFAEKYSEEN